ncbi:hypothetical protein VTI74DRAFT_8342 [Chaetomium olivicolor]
MAQNNWEPAALTALPVSLVLAAHLLLLAAVVTLMGLTHQLNGFVEIKTKEDPFLKSVGQDLSFVWSSLPPLILQFFTLARNWTADEAAFREPFAELGRTDCHDDDTRTNTSTQPSSQPTPSQPSTQPESTTPPSQPPSQSTVQTANDTTSPLLGHRTPSPNAHLTLLLDYRATNITLRWLAALRNGHLHLALASFLSLVFLVFVTPFSAALINDADVSFNSTVPMRSSFRLVETFPLMTTDWTSILEAAISEDVYKAARTPWTNGTHAFQPFEPDVELKRGSLGEGGEGEKAVVVTARSRAFDVRLSCVALEFASGNGAAGDGSVTASFESYDNETVYGGQVTVKATDRGCYIERRFSISATARPVVVEVAAQGGCEGAKEYPTRIMFLTGEYDQTASSRLGKLAVKSCIPVYETTEGELTVTWGNGTGNGLSSIVHFKALSRTMPGKFTYGTSFEEGVIEVKEAGYAGVTLASPSMFGRLVVERAAEILGRNGKPVASDGDKIPVAVANPDVIPEAMQLALASTYRISVARLGFQRRAQIEPGFGEGIVQTPQKRLFVRDWMGGCVIAFTLLSAGSTVLLVVHRRRRPCPLTEKPEGLLSYACLLHGSDAKVRAMLEDAVRIAGADEKPSDAAKKAWALQDAHFYLGRVSETRMPRALRAQNLHKR